MSLYNMLFGYNPLTGVVLSALNIDTSNIPRFRDAYYNAEDNHLVILTRTGGGNRDHYENMDSRRNSWWCELDVPTEDDLAGPYNEDLRKHPNFLWDQDDDFDNTYAVFFYSVPEAFEPIFNTYKDINAGLDNPMERFKQMIEDLSSGNSTPETERAKEVGTSLVNAILNNRDET